MLVTLGCCVTPPQTGQLTQQMHHPPPVPEAAKSPVDLVSGEGLIPRLQVAGCLDAAFSCVGRALVLLHHRPTVFIPTWGSTFVASPNPHHRPEANHLTLSHGK